MQDKETHTYDYLIVGQGLAGSLLGYELFKSGYEVKIIDDGFKNCASKMAAGIINPITGQRIVKSWKIDQFLPLAQCFYKRIEKELSLSCYKEYEVLRVIRNDFEYAQYKRRKEDKGYMSYLDEYFESGSFYGILKDYWGSFVIQQAAQVDISSLLLKINEFFKTQNRIEEGKFDYSGLQFCDGVIFYQNCYYKKVIFCEGAGVLGNPWFKDLNWNFAKGEIVTLKLLEEEKQLNNRILNAGKWLLPLGNGMYKAGSNYIWNDLDYSVTQLGREAILNAIFEEVLVSNRFELLKQEVGIRPATRDFRPYIGFHKEYTQLGIFNGFGSKGVLMIPYYINQLIDYFEKGLSMDSEVSIDR